MPKTKYDVIVVGTGIGGSACGALLAKAGLKTLILEKNDKIGGICSYYEKKGFHCDVGTHTFSSGNKGPLGEVTRRLGVPGAIQFIKAPYPQIKGLGFDLMMPQSIFGMPSFMYQMIKQLNLDISDIPNVMKFLRLFSGSSDEMIKEWDHRPIEELVLNHTQNPRFMAYISLMMGLCFGLPFWDASTGESLFSNKEARKARMWGYPRGGAYAIPKTYITAGEHYGADVLTNVKVSKIKIKNSSVAAVETSDGRSFETRAVVSTTSLKDTVLKLTGRRYFPAEFVKMVEDLTISTCGVQAKIALDRPVIKSSMIFGFGQTDKSLDVNNLSHADVYGIFEDLTAGRLPKIITLYCTIPTNFDPSLGPRGKQLLVLCALAPTTDIKLKDPYSKWIDAMLGTFQEEFPEIKNHIEWIDTFDVKFIENWIGKMYGPAISTGQTPNQVADKRPSVRSPIRGLYFAGDCAGGRGIGTELAATSAMECADMVISDNILHLF